MMMNVFQKIWKTVSSLFNQDDETQIRNSMWCDGYSDLEIDLAISDYREALKRFEILEKQTTQPTKIRNE